MTSQSPSPSFANLWLATGAPPEIKAVMAGEDDMGKIAIEAVKTQISLYNSTVASAQKQRDSGIPSLFDAVAYKIGDVLGEDPDTTLDAISGLAEPVARRAMWKWEKLPYPVLRARRKMDNGTEQRASWTQSEATLPTVDDWIAQNEKWLRVNMTLDKGRGGLVDFFTHVDVIFDNSTLDDSSRKILRPTLTGYCILDKLRLPEVEIQPSLPAFRDRFSQLTNNQLRGLDWTNVFVAGGMVLGTMLAIGDKQPALMESSDIDMYIYGLQPPEANAKIEHLYTIFKSNLPPSANILVVRNSKTITFFSQFPLRRLQIILKIVNTPKDVLLSFDLDICAMGFDGQDVWMLPRAARALETGYNVFTMDMIQGHYLAERRATQEQRVFKYAYKGYGIRFLPSYIESLPQGLLNKKIMRGGKYVSLVVEIGVKVGHYHINSNNIPIVSHEGIDFGNHNTQEPGGRSCLTGFELFCRHITLWNEEQAGMLTIPPDHWTTTTYESLMSGYNVSPSYQWDATFTLEELEDDLRLFNDSQIGEFLDAMLQGHNGLDPERWPDYGESIPQCSFSPDLHKVMEPEGNITMPVLVPFQFFKFANEMVVQTLTEKGLPATVPLVLVDHLGVPPELESGVVTREFWALWTIDQNSMWQQLDRRIDEVFEVLWSLRHASGIPWVDDGNRMNILKNQISRRSIRKTPTDELASFAQWVARDAKYPDPARFRDAFGREFQWQISPDS